VTLRNQDNGSAVSDVPMLLDTGADVTLIPQSSVNQLGLNIDPNEGYELMAFDGSTSIAQVVRVDLIAIGRAIRDLQRLRKHYGMGRWRKLKGVAKIPTQDRNECDLLNCTGTRRTVSASGK
jgi:hypothetical protein